MYSKNACHSELVFTKVIDDPRPWELKRSFAFEIEANSINSHRFNVMFWFWNHGCVCLHLSLCVNFIDSLRVTIKNFIVDVTSVDGQT